MRVRPFVREAGWELPASLDALLPANHPVRFVAHYALPEGVFKVLRLGTLQCRIENGLKSAHFLLLTSSVFRIGLEACGDGIQF